MFHTFCCDSFCTEICKISRDPSNSLKPYDFVRPLIIVVLIISFNSILNIVDKVTTVCDNTLIAPIYAATTKDESNVLQKVQEQTKAADQKTSPLGILASIGAVLNKISTAIYTSVFEVIRAILEVLNMFTYPAALLTRFAGLFFLRIVGPIALCFSLFDKYKDSFWSWVRQYSLYYSWAYALFIINIFFYLAIRATHTSMLTSYFSSLSSDQQEIQLSLMIGACAIAKYALYRKSYTLMSEIITGK